MTQVRRVFVTGLLLLACYTVLQGVIGRVASSVLRQILHREGENVEDALETSAAAKEFLTRTVTIALVIATVVIIWALIYAASRLTPWRAPRAGRRASWRVPNFGRCVGVCATFSVILATRVRDPCRFDLGHERSHSRAANRCPAPSV